MELSRFMPVLFGAIAAFMLACSLAVSPAGADPSEAQDVLMARCDQGIAMGCLDMGLKKVATGSLAEQEARALGYFERACTLGSARACALAARGHYQALGTPIRDLMKAISYGTSACDGNDSDGCYHLGIVYRNATGLPNHAARATELFAKSCTLGSIMGCAAARPVSAAQSTPNAQSAQTAQAGNVVPAAQTGAQVAATPRNCLTEEDYATCWRETFGSGEGQYSRPRRLSPPLTAPSAPQPARSSGFSSVCDLNSGIGCVAQNRAYVAAEPEAPASSIAQCAAANSSRVDYLQCSQAVRALNAQAGSGPSAARVGDVEFERPSISGNSDAGRVVCTTSSAASRRFTYTNSFPGSAERLTEYKRSYASMQASLTSRLNGFGLDGRANNETATHDCSWFATQTQATIFIDRAIAQAGRDQMTTNQSYFSTN